MVTPYAGWFRPAGFFLIVPTLRRGNVCPRRSRATRPACRRSGQARGSHAGAWEPSKLRIDYGAVVAVGVADVAGVVVGAAGAIGIAAGAAETGTQG